MTYVEFSLAVCPEDDSVTGNVMCSGDDALDEECEDRVIADLDGGNVWAWASVSVSARIGGTECIDYLGHCNYKSEDDFRKDAYYLDMKGEALSALRSELEGAIERAEKELDAERVAYDKRQGELEWWRCPHCKDVAAVDPGYGTIPHCDECATDRDRFDPVDVVFLRDDDGGDVVAVFPGEAATVGNPSHMTCYAHIGQHSGAGTAYCAGCSEVTDPKEYADLSAELDRIGYNQHVVRKDCMFSAKYTNARCKQLQM